jgi:hypothetical protein
MREHVMIWGLLCIGLTFPVVSIALAPQARSQGREKTRAQQAPDEATSLGMSPGIVCRSIDGYEDYEPLEGAAQTAEEKLLVYIRPFGFKNEFKEGYYHAHLVPDFQIRRRGEKAIIFQKKKMFEYKPKSRRPIRFIYLKNTIALKDSESKTGLPPGDYELTIILHDEIAKGPAASQVVKFKVIPPDDPRQKAN